MPRPRQCRYVAQHPSVTFFKPRGIPMSELTTVTLSVEGLEAIRLADWQGLSMEAAASRMRVSRHTFGRLLNESRQLVADALVHGKALCIEGGQYVLTPPPRAERTTEGSMRIAVSSEGTELSSQVDPRFGRAGGFLLVDADTMQASYLDNGASQTMGQGAGIETAERMAAAGVDVVLSGFVGPKAFEALTAAGIKVCQEMDGMTVQEAVERFKSGAVPFADAPNK